MKKTYDKSRKTKGTQAQPRPRRTKLSERAIRFFKDNSKRPSSSILADFRRLDQSSQAARRRGLVDVLADRSLVRDQKLRDGAVRLMVALLPDTFPILEKILSDCSSPLWYEIHFTTFSSLDRSDLSEADQAKVVSLVEKYLMNVKSRAGFAAWKAGDLLGDEWRTAQTVRVLEKVSNLARHAAGRRAAIHGISEAIEKAKASDQQRLLSLLRTIASEDISAEVRGDAMYTLKWLPQIGKEEGPPVFTSA